MRAIKFTVRPILRFLVRGVGQRARNLDIAVTPTASGFVHRVLPPILAFAFAVASSLRLIDDAIGAEIPA
jgi:hypothetical protein